MKGSGIKQTLLVSLLEVQIFSFKKKKQSNDDEDGFFFFFYCHCWKMDSHLGPLTLKKNLSPPFEEFNYGVLDLFIVWSGRIGPRAGDERRDRVISLPPRASEAPERRPRAKTLQP